MEKLGLALPFFDGIRSERLLARLLQAKRDYLGMHTCERVDKPRGEFFHTHQPGVAVAQRFSSSTTMTPIGVPIT